MRRTVLASCASAVLAIGLAACGDDVARPTQTTVARIGAPNFATLAPTPPTTTTTSLPPGETLAPDAVSSEGTGTYTIRSNDSLSRIASNHDITINELCRLNRFDDCPKTLLIPGNDVIVPLVEGDDDEAMLLDPLLAAPPAEGDTCEDGSLRGTYEITTADTSQSRAARRIGVSLELLEWVNRGNSVWRSFVPGTKLLVPCSDEELPSYATGTIALDPDSTVI